MREIQGLSSSLPWYSSCFIPFIVFFLKDAHNAVHNLCNLSKISKHIYQATVLFLWTFKAHLLITILAKRAGGIEKAFNHPEFSDASWLQTVIQPEDAQLQDRNDISVVHVISDFPCMSWGSLLSETWAGSLRWPRKIRRRKKGLNRTEISFLGCFCVLFSLLFVCFQT